MTANQSPGKAQETQLPGSGPENIPALQTAVKDAKATRELMFTLRHFHLGDPSAMQHLTALGGDHLPALLDPFRDSSRLRYDYPLFLYPPDSNTEHQGAESLQTPLAQWLKETMQVLAPDKGQARILKDHLPWIEQRIREMLRGREGPVEAAATLMETDHELQKHLGLRKPDRDQLNQDFEKLFKRYPPMRNSWVMAAIRPSIC